MIITTGGDENGAKDVISCIVSLLGFTVSCAGFALAFLNPLTGCFSFVLAGCTYTVSVWQVKDACNW